MSKKTDFEVKSVVQPKASKVDFGALRRIITAHDPESSLGSYGSSQGLDTQFLLKLQTLVFEKGTAADLGPMTSSVLLLFGAMTDLALEDHLLLLTTLIAELRSRVKSSEEEPSSMVKEQIQRFCKLAQGLQRFSGVLAQRTEPDISTLVFKVALLTGDLCFFQTAFHEPLVSLLTFLLGNKKQAFRVKSLQRVQPPVIYVLNKSLQSRDQASTENVTRGLKIVRDLLYGGVPFKGVDLCGELEGWMRSTDIPRSSILDLFRIASRLSDDPGQSLRLSRVPDLERLISERFVSTDSSLLVQALLLNCLNNLVLSSNQFAHRLVTSELFAQITSRFIGCVQTMSAQGCEASQMGKSFARFEVVRYERNEVLERIMLLLANVFSEESNSIELIARNMGVYKQLMRHLVSLLDSDFKAGDCSFIQSATVFMSNIFFFEEKLLLPADFELADFKAKIVEFVLRVLCNDQLEAVVSDGLRVLANVCKQRTVSNQVLSLAFLASPLIRVPRAA